MILVKWGHKITIWKPVCVCVTSSCDLHVGHVRHISPRQTCFTSDLEKKQHKNLLISDTEIDLQTKMAAKVSAVIFYVGVSTLLVAGQILPAERAIIEIAPKIHNLLKINSVENVNRDLLYHKLASLASTDLLSQALQELESGNVSSRDLHLDRLSLKAQTYNISEQCNEDSAFFIESTLGGQTWAIKFLDSWGKPNAGLLQGAVKWAGSYQQCQSLVSPAFSPDNVTKQRDFVGKYCNTGLTPIPFSPTASLGITIGTCFPSSCTDLDIGIMLNTMIYLLMKESPIWVNSVSCQPTSRDSVHLSTAAVVMICVLSLIGLLMLLGTTYDVLIYQRKISRAQEIQSIPPAPQEVNHEPDSHLDVEDYTPLVKQLDRNEAKVQVEQNTPTWQGFLVGFSVCTNGAKLLRGSQSQDVGCLHGLRFLSMTWVILGHTLVFTVMGGDFLVTRHIRVMFCFSVYTNGSKLLARCQSRDLGCIHGIRFLSMSWIFAGHSMMFTLNYYNFWNFALKFLLGFSILINGKKVLSVTTVTTSGRSDTVTLTCLHGLRFLSMTWVILGHTYYFCSALITRHIRVMFCFSVYTNGSKLLARCQSRDLGCIHGIRFLSMSWIFAGHSMMFTLNYYNFWNFALKFLLGFSILINGKKVLSVTTATTPGRSDTVTLTCLHGLRFLSMTWVILGHTYVFCAALINNMAQFAVLLNRWTFQALVGATVSVDSFFFLSGLLVAYLCLREIKKREGILKFNWAMFYIHRFWRLTPPYMLLLGSMAALQMYLGSGPFWPTVDVNEVCKDNWWTNLLYVNNLVRPAKMCMAWTWYLANDMQFFVISPLFLILLYINGILGTCAVLLVMIVSFVATGVISTQNYFLPMQASVSPFAAHLAQNHSQTDMFNHLYIVPWTRIGPYLVGILVGYAIYRTDRKFKMHWITVVCGWILAAACNLAVLYGMYDVTRGRSSPSIHVLSFYNTVHRTAWALGLGWVVFACVNGYGGFVNTLLSWGGMVPLSRLTYMAYLVHPIVMEVYYYSMQQPLLYSDFSFIYLFFGHLVLSYMCAFVLSLAFESPMLALEKLVFKPLADATSRLAGLIWVGVRRLACRPVDGA